ncbi:MAG: S8 family serine peptidase [Acidobacteria bacterium]|nr:S8 family serine peptidase [Acidobacteriota bacterium]
MYDPMIDRQLDSFGFDKVLVVLKKDVASPAAGELMALEAVAGGSKAARKAGKRKSKESQEADKKKVSRHFLDQAPDAATGVTASLAADASPASEQPPVRYFPLLGVALGYVDRAGAQALDNEDKVEAVYHADPLSIIRPVTVKAATATAKATWGLRELGIEKLWKEGLTGEDIAVGHLDTGVDGKHAAIKKRIAAFAEFDFEGERVAKSSPHDSGRHGTHTAGTICGGKVNGMSIGVAPKAELHSGLVIEGGQVLLRLLAGMEWALEQEVRVLSMSLGIRGFTPFLLDVTKNIRQSGALPVFAIGNEGVGTSRSPGNYAEALSVGAIDRSKRVANFSSSTTFQRSEEPNQPNVVAPGVDIISAKPGGGVLSMNGTSMATPHVAGVAALLFQAKPDASVEEVEDAIQTTCTLLQNESQLRYGFGLINPRAALEKLRA